jgi:hypothetical protein
MRRTVLPFCLSVLLTVTAVGSNVQPRQDAGENPTGYRAEGTAQRVDLLRHHKQGEIDADLRSLRLNNNLVLASSRQRLTLVREPQSRSLFLKSLQSGARKMVEEALRRPAPSQVDSAQRVNRLARTDIAGAEILRPVRTKTIGTKPLMELDSLRELQFPPSEPFKR